MRRIRKRIWNPSHPYLHLKNSTWNLFLSCNMLILRQRVSHKTQHFKGNTLTRAIQLLNENPRDSRNWSMHKEQNFTPINCLLSHRGAQGGWDLYFYSRQTHTARSKTTRRHKATVICHLVHQFAFQLSPQYTARWHRQKGVRNLPKISYVYPD